MKKIEKLLKKIRGSILKIKKDRENKRGKGRWHHTKGSLTTYVA
jgi:hypothetical protein